MPEADANARLEAFCDGVFAIALTLLISTSGSLPRTHHQHGRNLARASASGSGGVRVPLELRHHPDHVGQPSCGAEAGARSSPSFIYANGFLLLTVVSPPSRRLLGEFSGPTTRTPAVVLYNAVLAIQAIAWILVTGAALKDHLSMTTSGGHDAREQAKWIFRIRALFPARRRGAVVSSRIAVVTTRRGSSGWC